MAKKIIKKIIKKIVKKTPKKKKVRVRKPLGGRPPVKIAITLKRLEDGFMTGFNIMEACLYAEVSREWFYEYIKKNKGFSDRIDMLKNKPSMIAKNNLLKKINAGDEAISKWWLERKNKDEFSTQVETVNKFDDTQTVEVKITKKDKAEFDKHILEALNGDKQKP